MSTHRRPPNSRATPAVKSNYQLLLEELLTQYETRMDECNLEEATRRHVRKLVKQTFNRLNQAAINIAFQMPNGGSEFALQMMSDVAQVMKDDRDSRALSAVTTAAPQLGLHLVLKPVRKLLH